MDQFNRPFFFKRNSTESAITLLPGSWLLPLCFLFFNILPLTIVCQIQDIDRLEKEVKSSYGFERLEILNKLTSYFIEENQKKAVRYGKQGVSFAENLYDASQVSAHSDRKMEILNAFFYLGKAYYVKGDYFDARHNLEYAEIFSNIFEIDK